MRKEGTIRRKNIIRIIIIFTLGMVLSIHILCALCQNKDIEYKEISFSSPKISELLDGYKIAFIVDTHATTVPDLEKVVKEVNALQPDLLLLGGDFPASPGAPQRSMAVLSQVQARDGIFGVEGNHDNYMELFSAMEEYGITPLSNSGQQVRPGLFVSGIEDLWNRNPDIETAVQNAGKDDFVLLLAHNPDVTMQQDTTKVDLILSGHTHGGQVNFLGLWAPALTLSKSITQYGQRFMSGWALSYDGTSVYVSNGTGYLQNVPRVFARPQVILLTLEKENGQSG